MKITIGHLYPDLLNLYGDRGNIQCMKMRLVWRGFEAEVREFNLGDTIDFSDLDIVLLGGGSDREQMLVCEKLQSIREDFEDYVNDGGSVLAVCGGYQLLGHYYDTSKGRMEGLHLADLYTEQGSPRLISNIVLENEDFPYPIVGFENHGGRTYLGRNPVVSGQTGSSEKSWERGDLRPFGKVLFGHGNNDQDGVEGILYQNIVGTYLHGPLLPKNPHVCDYLLRNALLRKGFSGELEPLDDAEEIEANTIIMHRFVK